MRAPLLTVGIGAAAISAALLLASSAAAHEGRQGHMEFNEGTLAPSESFETGLEFGEGELQEGWVFLFSTQVQSPSTPLDVRLWINETTAAEWTIPPGDTVVKSALLPETGFYNLTLSNPSQTETLSYGYFFDQSCNCIGKFLPINITNGVVVFNVDLDAGMGVKGTIPDPVAADVRVELATLKDGSEGIWPRDFEVLETSENVEAHRFDFRADRTTRYYFFTTMVEPKPEEYDDLFDIGIRPIFEFTDVGTGGSGEPPCEVLGNCPKNTPGLGAASAALAAAVALVLVRMFRRNT